MLVSDKYGFIIASPVKTGTTTLLGIGTAWARQGGSSSVLRVLYGESEAKHRTAPPAGCEGYDRFMTIRDPSSRLPSMYEWMRKWPHPATLHNVILDAEQRKGRKQGWREFIRAIAVTRDSHGYADGGRRRKGTRQPYMWTDTQVEHFTYLQGVDADGSLLPWYREDVPGILNTEDLGSCWAALLSDVGVDEDALYELRVGRLNRSRDRLASGVDGYWDALGRAERALFVGLCEPDVDAFG